MRISISFLPNLRPTSHGTELVEPLVESTEPSKPPVTTSTVETPPLLKPLPTVGGTISLKNRNLILVGDSNDRKFFFILCQHLGGYITEIDKLLRPQDAAMFPGAVTWPTDAKNLLCHDEGRNASAMFLFHHGLFSLPPQASWYLDFAKRRMGTHFLGVRGKAIIISSTDLAHFIWPALIRQHLPSRPLLVLAQSSMWDSMAVLESVIGKRVSQMSDLDLQKLMTLSFSETNLTELRWLGRATEFITAIREGFTREGLQIESLFWRTNPDCPALPQDGSLVANALSRLCAEAVRHEMKGGQPPWTEMCLVDWRSRLEITNPKQCDKHHYTKQGYAEYLAALKECLLIEEKQEKMKWSAG